MEGGRAALLVTPPSLTRHRSIEGSGGGGEGVACEEKKEKGFVRRSEETPEERAGRQVSATSRVFPLRVFKIKPLHWVTLTDRFL